MASITNDPGGRKRITFTDPNGGRKTIRLGEMPDRLAETYRENIEHLVACSNAPHMISKDVLKWTTDIPQAIHKRFVKASLLPSREPVQATKWTMQELIKDVEAEIAHTKPFTRQFYARVFFLLAEHFGQDREIASISPREADAFVTWLRTEKKQGPATVARRIKACRFIFRRAMRWEMTNRDPFRDIKAGSSVNSSRKAFIPLDDVEKLMETTLDLEFRAILALCRLAALRCPSEVVMLRWADVRWGEGKLMVRSPKTEGYEGGASRIVPLFPRLAEVLMDLYTSLPEGAGEFVVTSNRGVGINWRTKLKRLIIKAGIKSWPKLFHNMRASRESELCAEYPLTTVCGWLGHRPEVAAAHYLTDPDRDASFQKARGLCGTQAGKNAGQATRNPTRTEAKLEVNKGNLENATVAKTPENAAFLGVLGGGESRPTGIEPITVRLEGGCSIQLSYGRSAPIIMYPARRGTSTFHPAHAPSPPTL